MTATTPAIETHGLSKTFGRTEALAPLDLVIPRGAIFALVGHNGAGKTTLIKLLLNILRPTHGSATILGESTADLTGESFTHIGYVSENQELPDWMTVQAMMNYLRPFYPTWDAANLLADLDLRPDRKLKQLSRGMRMKAALASVLAFRPPLIVMDEPFSGLDPLVRDELIKALLDCMNDEYDTGPDSGTTILISSHDLAEVESFATHVAFLHQGKLLFAESMATLTARFREVTVTLDPSSTPASFTPPTTWLLPESSAAVYRFIHTNAEADSLEEQVRSLLPHATAIQSEPMSLRTIFLALAKSSQTQDRSRT
jgi:ABC-2 type transport system ATP-binding protein